MSDENKEKCTGKGFKKWAFGLVVGTFIVSLATMIMVIMMITQNAMPSASTAKPIVISKQYDKGQTIDKALKTDKPVIVWFYTDWCGYCQKFAPTFGKITKDRKIKKNFAVAYVNADVPENRKYMDEYQVQGFPTVFLVDPKTGNKETVDNQKLFSADAIKELKDEFLDFAEKKEEKTED